MSTPAQISANRANAEKSTGPRSDAGKASSAHNSFRHGLTGPFCILPWENADEFHSLECDFTNEHQPVTATEFILVKEMAQSHWLSQRAIRLQNTCFHHTQEETTDPHQLSLYLRYQNTHQRAFYKALNQLIKLREQKRKAEIGFVSQNHKEAREKLADERRAAREQRSAAAEDRAQELHEARVWLLQAHARRHETETTIAKFFKLPNHGQPETAEAA